MVGPLSSEERRRGIRRVAGGFAAVVAVSSGLMAYRSGATAVEAGVVTLAGLLFGVVLLLLVVGRW